MLNKCINLIIAVINVLIVETSDVMADCCSKRFEISAVEQTGYTVTDTIRVTRVSSVLTALALDIETSVLEVDELDTTLDPELMTLET